MKFEPVPGYSVPVVRVSRDDGQVLASLSFSESGQPINPPKFIGAQVQALAWNAWVASKQGAQA